VCPKPSLTKDESIIDYPASAESLSDKFQVPETITYKMLENGLDFCARNKWTNFYYWEVRDGRENILQKSFQANISMKLTRNNLTPIKVRYDYFFILTIKLCHIFLIKKIYF
jgi:hypothetical protein